MTLFLSALSTYRRAQICEPYPDEFFLEDGEKDFETVVLSWLFSLSLFLFIFFALIQFFDSFTLQSLYANAIPNMTHFKTSPNALRNLPAPALALLSWVVDTELYEGMTLSEIPLSQVIAPHFLLISFFRVYCRSTNEKRMGLTPCKVNILIRNMCSKSHHFLS